MPRVTAPSAPSRPTDPSEEVTPKPGPAPVAPPQQSTQPQRVPGQTQLRAIEKWGRSTPADL